jgi:malonate transporter and related proteins
MLSTLPVVIPVFALVFAGWAARRSAVLGPQATRELNRFVVYLALPALLFDIVAHARWGDIWQPGFIAVFAGGSGVIFALTLILRLRAPRHLADATIDGLNAGYANTGFIGFPLVTAVLGRDALPPTLVATILTVCVLFAVAIVLIEVGVQTETRPLRLAAKVGRSLGKNPLLVAPIGGALLRLTGFTVPDSAESFLKLLGGAASPCALVTLGLFLAEPRGARTGGRTAVMLVSALKLLGQPALTFALARWVFPLPPALLHTAVLLAGLPTGTGPFMLAEFYGREADLTARAILVTTVLSLLTTAGYLATFQV